MVQNGDEIGRSKLKPNLSLDSSVHQPLYPYFMQASLNSANTGFMDLYADTEMEGVQLERLKKELNKALSELKDMEIQIFLKKFIQLISEALEKNLMLIAIGD